MTEPIAWGSDATTAPALNNSCLNTTVPRLRVKMKLQGHAKLTGSQGLV